MTYLHFIDFFKIRKNTSDKFKIKNLKIEGGFVELDDELYDELITEVETHKEENIFYTSYGDIDINGDINSFLFPPCMKNILIKLKKGINLTHTERFNLTAFLFRLGVSKKYIVGLFLPSPDYETAVTEYQVDHICCGGNGGGGYNPSSCKTMYKNGDCNISITDEYCKQINHPLDYYMLKYYELQ